MTIRLTVAENGAAGLEAVQEQVPDLVGASAGARSERRDPRTQPGQPATRSPPGRCRRQPPLIAGRQWAGSEEFYSWGYLDLNQGPLPYQGSALTD
jgi:hypothetical protein